MMGRKNDAQRYKLAFWIASALDFIHAEALCITISIRVTLSSMTRVARSSPTFASRASSTLARNLRMSLTKNQIRTNFASRERSCIVHRDLHSRNIVVDGTGRPLITNFGLSRKLDSGEESTDVVA